MNKLELQISSTTRRRRRPAGPSSIVTSRAKVVSISPSPHCPSNALRSRYGGRRRSRGPRGGIGHRAVGELDEGGRPRRAGPAGAAGGDHGEYEDADAHRGHDPPGGTRGGGEARGQRAV